MNSILLLLVGIILLVTSVSSIGENKYLSCSQINSFCLDQGLADATVPTRSRHATCKTGKSGPKGERGNPGPQGPPGKITYDEFERKILLKVKDMIINCRVVYNNSCFTLVGKYGNKYSKEDLQRMCENIGANLGNIYNEEHRLKINRYVRSETAVYVQVALGMTYNPQENTFRHTDGKITPADLSWHPGYPQTTVISQNMFVSVQPSAASTSQGAFNHKPLSDAFGLCEYPIGL